MNLPIMEVLSSIADIQYIDTFCILNPIQKISTNIDDLAITADTKL